MPNNFPPLTSDLPITSAYIHYKINSSDMGRAAGEEVPFIPNTVTPLHLPGAGTPPPSQVLLNLQSVAGPRPSSCPSPESYCSGSIDDEASSIVASSPVQSSLLPPDQTLLTVATAHGYPSVGEMFGVFEMEFEMALRRNRSDDCSVSPSSTAHLAPSSSAQVTPPLDSRPLYDLQSQQQRPTDFPPPFPARPDFPSGSTPAYRTPMTSQEAVRLTTPPGFIQQRPLMHPAATTNLWSPTSALTNSQRSTELFRHQQLLNGLEHIQINQAQATSRLNYQHHQRGYSSRTDPLMPDIFSPTSDASSSLFSTSTLDNSPVFSGGQSILPGNNAMMQQQQQHHRTRAISQSSQHIASHQPTMIPGGDSSMMGERLVPSSSLPVPQLQPSIAAALVNHWNSPSDGLSSCDEQFSDPESALALSAASSPQRTTGRGRKATGKRPKQRNNPVKPVVLRRQLVNAKHNSNGPVPASLQLWEFILHHLELDLCKDAIAWIDDHTGKFRIVNSEKIARMWGDYRAVPAMDYEKMTRALRYYYKRRILEKLQRRLIYQFSLEVMQQVRSYRPADTSD